ncbi:hypothetical protein ACH5RR_036045 [Cinchona calisaya]|uniref:F-box/LRR-repeat protein 15/At3g58940/PEG3-like LRR domain-containing protein n=1 Tax=Cinchona calisaya TaxID=153742 RepID=A0ABD2Y4G8_9GENT
MPSAFFSCQQLRRLNIRFCSSNPPRTVNGFGQLIKLKLLKVDIEDKVFGSLISSCPLLEEMQLEMLSILNHLEIVAPKLRLFCVGSAIKAILFRNTPALTMVSLAICGPSVAAIFDQVGRDIIDHFGFLSNLENLHLDYYFLNVKVVSFL